MRMHIRIASFFLSVFLLMSLVACSKTSNKTTDTEPEIAMESPVVGQWQCAVNMGEMMDFYANHYYVEQSRFSGIKSIIGDCEFLLRLDLNEDGTISFQVDRGSVDAINKVLEDSTPTLLAAKMGISLEELERYLQNNGMTIEEYMDMTGVQVLLTDCRDLIPLEDFNGIYSVEGDRLYIGLGGQAINKDGYFVFSATDDTLTIQDIVGDDLGELLPATFMRLD